MCIRDSSDCHRATPRVGSRQSSAAFAHGRFHGSGAVVPSTVPVLCRLARCCLLYTSPSPRD
eukprot:10833232-Alexandrium_andersonii.AAC.1